MLEPIRFGAVETNLLGIIIYCLLAIVVVCFIIISLIKKIKEEIKRNKEEKHLSMLYGPRILCTDCKYCKKSSTGHIIILMNLHTISPRIAENSK